MTQAGHVLVLFGPMFSGKTSELMRRVRRLHANGQEVMVVKWEGDTRYEAATNPPTALIHAHDPGQAMVAIPYASADEIEKRVIQRPPSSSRPLPLLAIDEGQFFPGLADVARRLVDQGHVRVVIIAALLKRFNGTLWPTSQELLLTCDQQCHYTAVCQTCHSDYATESARLTRDETEVIIGGQELYVPLCAPCYRRHMAAIVTTTTD